jgi:hypothetical protein
MMLNIFVVALFPVSLVKVMVGTAFGLPVTESILEELHIYNRGVVDVESGQHAGNYKRVLACWTGIKMGESQWCARNATGCMMQCAAA